MIRSRTMFKIRLLSKLAVLGLFAGGALGQAQPEPRGRALVVGIRDYAVYDRLEAGPEGAQAFADRLSPLLQLAAADLVTMTDAKDGTMLFPQASNIQTQLNELTQGSANNRWSVLAVFCRVDVIDGSPTLVPADLEPKRKDTHLPVSHVVQQLAAANRPFLFAVLANSSTTPAETLARDIGDACTKAGVAAAVVVVPPDADNQSASLAVAGLEMALTGAADFLPGSKTDGVLTAGELAAYLVAAQPVWGGQRTAQWATVASKAGHDLPIAQFHPPQARTTAITAWEEIRELAKTEGLTQAWERAHAAHEEANRLLAQGNYPKALATFETLTAACREVSALDKQRRQALAARATATHLAEEAVAARGTETAPQEMVKGFERVQRAQLAFSAGQFQAAAEDWTEATRTYGKISLDPIAARMEARVKAIDFDSLAAYAAEDWRRASQLLKQARTAAETNSHQEAITAYRQAEKALDEVTKGAIPGLLEQMQRFDHQQGAPMALVFANKVLTLQADHPAAREAIRRLRCNTRFQPGQPFSNSLRMTFVFIPPGSFVMGSPATEVDRGNDETQHKVSISLGFLLGMTEVSQAQWEAVMGGEYHPPQGLHPGDRRQGHMGPQLPKHTVSWEEATLFCKRLGQLDGRRYRLPTEAEWEYACRAGTQAPYHVGETLTSQQASIYDPNRDDEQPRQIATYSTTNAWGLKDMHGNVWEWCADWYGPYPDGPAVDPAGLPESEVTDINLSRKVIRGGSWRDDASEARSASRHGQMPQVGGTHVGFRVVLDAEDMDP